jgi:hypothetical protein
MLRVVLIALVLLLLPTAGYVAWRIYKQATTVGLEQEIDLSNAPWHWLIGGGLALVIVALVGSTLFGHRDPGQKYIPPTTVDGKIVPGRTVPRDEDDPSQLHR